MMSAELPPILVLLDLSAIMAGTTREWQEYSRVGKCFLSQVVYEEIEFLCNRAPEPNLEKTSREFMRFYPNSGWQLSTANEPHPSLTPADSQALSKQARLALATVQCAYGLSQEQTTQLVVLVSNSQPLLQRLQALEAPNLSGITATALLQWARTGQRPIAVTQQLQSMIRAGSSSGNSLLSGGSPVTRGTSPTAAPRPMTGPASAARIPASPSSQKGGRGLFSGLINSVLALTGVAIAALIVWAVIQPASFNQFWNKLGLPALPGQQPAQKSQPVNK
ncbi:MAG: hypothetical protein KME08_08435 [Aphanothece sp. CMT-3BRIN-NPC111]|jgi:hypothetical protein|nr:hypothetical protein [Aphanothece sp. CMT-3BRIN-NPC111]